MYYGHFYEYVTFRARDPHSRTTAEAQRASGDLYGSSPQAGPFGATAAKNKAFQRPVGGEAL